MTLPHETVLLAEEIIQKASEQGMTISTAESCTGGLVSAALTSVPGSSAVLDRAFVTYSNKAKMQMLSVPSDIIRQHGAVSGETARAMVCGALNASPADLAVSITGIAGPGGGSVEKPVGLVWFGFAERGHPARTERHIFANGDRDFVRNQATITALSFLLKALSPGEAKNQ